MWSARLTNWKQWLRIAVSRHYHEQSKSRLTWWTGPTIRPSGTRSSTARYSSKRTRMSAIKSFRSKPGLFSLFALSPLSLCVCPSSLCVYQNKTKQQQQFAWHTASQHAPLKQQFSIKKKWNSSFVLVSVEWRETTIISLVSVCVCVSTSWFVSVLVLYSCPYTQNVHKKTKTNEQNSRSTSKHYLLHVIYTNRLDLSNVGFCVLFCPCPILTWVIWLYTCTLLLLTVLLLTCLSRPNLHDGYGFGWLFWFGIVFG
jgi:hypothetical protein